MVRVIGGTAVRQPKRPFVPSCSDTTNPRALGKESLCDLTSTLATRVVMLVSLRQHGVVAGPTEHYRSIMPIARVGAPQGAAGPQMPHPGE